MKKQHKIDQLFKRGMEDPDIPFDELDWEKMVKKLAASETKRKPSLWIYAGAGIAASLLLVLFLFLSDQKVPVDQTKNVKTGSRSGAEDQKSAPSNPMSPSDERTDIAPATLDRYATKKQRQPKQGKSQFDRPLMPSKEKLPMLTLVPQVQILSSSELRKISRPLNLDEKRQGQQVFGEKQNAKSKIAILESPSEESGKLTFTLLAAPDVTDSKSSIGTKISSNFGLLLTYPISKKLSVSSGAIYARKLYDYGGTLSAAYGAAGRPWALNADCFVIDVPVNLNYQVLKKKNVSISINSGLSSYFMLKEKYKYRNTGLDGVEQTTALEINNQNQHLFGVANFSISVDRKVSDKVSIGVQPFLKVPLTGIGYYDYNLRSRGVAVSISIKPFGAKH